MYQKRSKTLKPTTSTTTKKKKNTKISDMCHFVSRYVFVV